jgi:hypothetical protein
MWLRKRWLERCWRDYPLYDPPHKREERILSKAEAAQNFDYFMSVRQQRDACFRDWLRRYFGVTVTLDEDGMRGLNRWGNKYAGFLLAREPRERTTSAYFTYSPPWIGRNGGNNVLFDMGITLGESIIASCPNLRWDFDPTSTILPRTAKERKRGAGSGFQRPMLTGFDNPAYCPMPLYDVYSFARQMAEHITTLKDLIEHYDRPRGIRNLVRDELLNKFKGILRNYPAGDPYKLLDQMGRRDYLNLVDAKVEADGDE